MGLSEMRSVIFSILKRDF